MCAYVEGFRLYGSSVHQAYRYFRLYPTDVVFLKLTVRVQWVGTIVFAHICGISSRYSL